MVGERFREGGLGGAGDAGDAGDARHIDVGGFAGIF